MDTPVSVHQDLNHNNRVLLTTTRTHRSVSTRTSTTTTGYFSLQHGHTSQCPPGPQPQQPGTSDYNTDTPVSVHQDLNHNNRVLLTTTRTHRTVSTRTSTTTTMYFSLQHGHTGQCSPGPRPQQPCTSHYNMDTPVSVHQDLNHNNHVLLTTTRTHRSVSTRTSTTINMYFSLQHRHTGQCPPGPQPQQPCTSDYNTDTPVSVHQDLNHNNHVLLTTTRTHRSVSTRTSTTTNMYF